MMKDDLDCLCALGKQGGVSIWEALDLFPLALINKRHKHRNPRQASGIKTLSKDLTSSEWAMPDTPDLAQRLPG